MAGARRAARVAPGRKPIRDDHDRARRKPPGAPRTERRDESHRARWLLGVGSCVCDSTVGPGSEPADGGLGRDRPACVSGRRRLGLGAGEPARRRRSSPPAAARHGWRWPPWPRRGSPRCVSCRRACSSISGAARSPPSIRTRSAATGMGPVSWRPSPWRPSRAPWCPPSSETRIGSSRRLPSGVSSEPPCPGYHEV
jgi:hypothetical protein